LLNCWGDRDSAARLCPLLEDDSTAVTFRVRGWANCGIGVAGFETAVEKGERESEREREQEEEI